MFEDSTVRPARQQTRASIIEGQGTRLMTFKVRRFTGRSDVFFIPSAFMNGFLVFASGSAEDDMLTRRWELPKGLGIGDNRYNAALRLR